MTNKRAVLWDMDGTLVDSADFHWLAWRDTMSREGCAVTYEQFRATFGQRNDSILRQWLGVDATCEVIQHIGNAKEALYRQHVREQGISALPGASEWLRRLHEEGWAQAIASAAPRANVETILEVLQASELFQAIVAAEDVHRGKPDPEVFLIAANKLSVETKNCIVVEDAKHGIEAALAAGMKTIGVSQNGNHLPADIVVRSLRLLDEDAFERLLGTAPCHANLTTHSTRGEAKAKMGIEYRYE